MAWINRRGRRYYRRSVREGARVRTEYLGAGPIAEARAELDAMDRALIAQLRTAARDGLETFRRDLAEQERPLVELAGQVRDLTKATLEAAGFHRHDRGPWRRRRAMTTEPAENKADRARDRTVLKLLTRAGKGDEAAMPTLRKLFDDFGRHGGPQGTAILIKLADGDPACEAESALIERVAGTNLARAEGTRRWIGRIKDELAGPDPSPLDRLLVDRVALCYADACHMDRRADLSSANGASLAYLESLDKRRSRANKRFLDAAKALAAVRKLALPALQVNIAENQINLIGSGVEGP